MTRSKMCGTVPCLKIALTNFNPDKKNENEEVQALGSVIIFVITLNYRPMFIKH